MFKQHMKMGVESAIGTALQPEDERVIEAIAERIQIYWWELACMVEIVTPDDCDKRYKEIQEEHQKNAVGVMIAVMEVLKAVGSGKSMPDEYIGLLQKMAGASS